MAKRSSGSNGLLVSGVSTLGAMAAATVARKTLRVTWRTVTGEPPPDHPHSRDTDWVVALMWAVASGAAIGVARMLVERQVIGRFVDDEV